eukprot:gb/GECG01000435.1/.p1 GENE.gb/GECG01000435.1/~~gb/GECG01000435.1/.p1  ORF type:complete len:256 (+),score=41.40 gb/GECG01000435.1/:1-768(+)
MLAQAEDDELALDIEKSIGAGRKVSRLQHYIPLALLAIAPVTLQMKKLRQREAIQKKRQEEELARKEDLLARELRIYTKGTAAAKAVFTSFRKTDDRRKPTQRETSASNEKPMLYPENPAETKTSRKRKPKYSLTSDARSAMKPSPDFENLKKKSLATSWNRHALNFYGKLVKEKSSNEHVEAHRTLSSTSLAAHELPQNTLSASTGAASYEYQERTRQPKKLDEEMRNEQMIPATTDPKFEDWLRFRFGKISTI